MFELLSSTHRVADPITKQNTNYTDAIKQAHIRTPDTHRAQRVRRCITNTCVGAYTHTNAHTNTGVAVTTRRHPAAVRTRGTHGSLRAAAPCDAVVPRGAPPGTTTVREARRGAIEPRRARRGQRRPARTVISYWADAAARRALRARAACGAVVPRVARRGLHSAARAVLSRGASDARCGGRRARAVRPGGARAHLWGCSACASVGCSIGAYGAHGAVEPRGARAGASRGCLRCSGAEGPRGALRARRCRRCDPIRDAVGADRADPTSPAASCRRRTRKAVVPRATRLRGCRARASICGTVGTHGARGAVEPRGAC